MVYSASSVMAELNPRYHSSIYFVLRQLVWVALSLVAHDVLQAHATTASCRPRRWPSRAIGIVLILLVLVYFLDPQHHRWLRLGPVGIAASEFAKPALVIFLAYFVTLARARHQQPRYTLLPAALAVGLVIAGGGGRRSRHGGGAGGHGGGGVLRRRPGVALLRRSRWRSALLGVVFFVASKPYRLARIVHFFDPELQTDRHVRSARPDQERICSKSLTTRDTSYQARQSKIAVGTGGPLGLGLMQGKQKLLYLPEAHTDFIYAVVGEELGLFGSVAVLAGFLVILWRGLRATRAHARRFRTISGAGRHVDAS